MELPNEPTIVINGHELTKAQAMSVRVGLGSFAMDLSQNGLGNDEHGRAMTIGYLAALGQIFKMMQSPP
jgi:hypothetical protein